MVDVEPGFGDFPESAALRRRLVHAVGERCGLGGLSVDERGRVRFSSGPLRVLEGEDVLACVQGGVKTLNSLARELARCEALSAFGRL